MLTIFYSGSILMKYIEIFLYLSTLENGQKKVTNFMQMFSTGMRRHDRPQYIYFWSGSIVNSAMSVMNTQISANKKARHKI